MKYDYPEQSFLSKTILAGVFAGIAGTLLNLGYDFAFRTLSRFAPSQIINVATIIFASMLFFTVAGLVYFFVSKFLKKGELIYIFFFAILTYWCSTLSMHTHRSADPKVTADFRLLLLGIVLFSGALATLFIPYLMKHQTIFLDEK